MIQSADGETYQKIIEAGHPVLHRIAILAATVAGGILIRRDAGNWKLSSRRKIEIFCVVALGSMFGASLPALFAGGYVGQLASSYFKSTSEITSGFATEYLLGPKTILGGLLFGFLFVAAYKRILKINYDTSDAFARGACLMMAIGRLGCIAQHCCFGITVSPHLGFDFGDGQPRFPIQAVEAVFLFGLFFFLNHLHRKNAFEHRRLFLLFTLYGLARFLFEFLRESIAATWLGLGFYQWLALGMAAVGIFQLVRRRPKISRTRRVRRRDRPSPEGSLAHPTHP